MSSTHSRGPEQGLEEEPGLGRDLVRMRTRLADVFAFSG